MVASGAVSRDCPLGFDAVLARARAGDEAGWAALYDSLAPQLLGYLRARGARDAEEVLGDVFLEVARGIDRFVGDASGFRSWVFVVATSRLHDERRRLRRKPTESLEPQAEEHLCGATDVEAEVEQAAAADEVQHLLRALTEEQRTVVQLRVFGDLTAQEVADVVGKPLGAVKALYRRGLGALRRQIERDLAGAGMPSESQRVDNVLPFPWPAVSLRASAAVTRGS